MPHAHKKGELNYFEHLPKDTPEEVRKLIREQLPKDMPEEARKHIEEQLKKNSKGSVDFYWKGDKDKPAPKKKTGNTGKHEAKKKTTYNSTMSRTVKASGKGELHYKKANGKETLKAIGPDGKVIFDGPINTPKEKAKVPAETMKWLEESLQNKSRRPDFRRQRDPFAPGSFTPKERRSTRPGKTTDA